jgi:hypothetical protein
MAAVTVTVRSRWSAVGGVVGRSRASACPPFIVALRERGSTAIQDKRPRSGRESDWFLIRRSHS